VHEPLPSQTTPPFSLHGAPTAAFDVPHAFAEQVTRTQAVALAAQSVGALHATQLPEPSHTLPLLSVHVAPIVAFVVTHAPPVHATVAHFVVDVVQSLVC